MNKKERYKKLMRKVKLAKRMREQYEEWLNEMDELDQWLADNEPNWKPGVHNKYRGGDDATN